MPTFAYFIEPSRVEMPVSPTEEEARMVGEHFAYLQAALNEGKLIMAGRTLEHPFLGVALFEAESREDAEAFACADPAIAAGVFIARVQPFGVALLKGSPSE